MAEPHETGPAWQPIGLLSQTPAKTAHPVLLEGEMLALWRDEEGQVQVWEDRCPHRGMRLSYGFVRGRRLTCLYHGWQYDRTGGCKYVPAHPDMTPPETITVRTFPVALAWGMIFAAPEGTSPDAPEAAGAGWEGVRSIHVARSAETLSAALAAGDIVIAGARLAATGPVHLGGEIAVGVQPVDAGRSALHVAARALSTEARLDIARALVALRYELDMKEVAA